MIVLAAVALVGLGLAFLLPANPLEVGEVQVKPPVAAPSARDTVA